MVSAFSLGAVGALLQLAATSPGLGDLTADPCAMAVLAAAAADAAQSPLKDKEHFKVCCSYFFPILNGPGLC